MAQMSQLSQFIQEFCQLQGLPCCLSGGHSATRQLPGPLEPRESWEAQGFPSATSISSHSFWPGLILHPRVTLDINKINQKHIRKCIGQSAWVQFLQVKLHELWGDLIAAFQ